MVAAIIVIALASGCSADSSGSSGAASLADFDTRIPDAIASHVPLPEEAEVRVSMVREDEMTVMFLPGISWPDSLSFFSSSLPAYGWELETEKLPEETEGGREARWVAHGHDHTLTISLRAFGGVDGSNMTGLIMLEEH